MSTKPNHPNIPRTPSICFMLPQIPRVHLGNDATPGLDNPLHPNPNPNPNPSNPPTSSNSNFTIHPIPERPGIQNTVKSTGEKEKEKEKEKEEKDSSVVSMRGGGYDYYDYYDYYDEDGDEDEDKENKHKKVQDVTEVGEVDVDVDEDGDWIMSERDPEN